jgi:23S rRNA (uracil1939-C5)-methyltransferase
LNDIQKNDIYTAEITDMTNLGSGVCRVDGMAVFVAGGADGDTAEIKIIKVARDYAVARIERLIKPSPHRISDACPVSRRCGGCVYRSVTYEHELELKRARVVSAFRKAGLEPDVAGVLKTGKTDGWRNKIQLPVGEDGKIGYYAPHSHDIVECGSCALQLRGFDPVVSYIAGRIRGGPRGCIRHICLRGGSGGIMVCLVARRTFPGQSALADDIVNRFPEVKSVVLNINDRDTNVIYGERFITLEGEDYIEDTLLGLRFRISPASFYQVNRGAAELAYKKLRDIAGIRSGDIICDLFCGTGTIGLYLKSSTAAARLTGIEVVREAAENARANAALNGISDAEFICADADRCGGLIVGADIVVVDPPRKGLSPGLISDIAAAGPRAVAYMSCDPDTLARDCRIFAEKGYMMGQVTPVDMFPRTGHVECVVLITRVKE